MKPIAIITGGDSEEREISLISAQAVKGGLEELGKNDIARYDIPTDLQLLENDLNEKKFDFAFVMGHGKGLEDGQIVGLLDLYGASYQCTSRDVLALTMNKYWTKCVWKSFGLPIADDFIFQLGDYSVDELDAEISNTFGYPCVWKELDQGSSKGVYIITSASDLQKTRSLYDKMKQVILLEEFIAGEEITMPILDIDGVATALPLIHIIPPDEGGFDFENKYNGSTKEICPSGFAKEIIHECEQIALQAYLAVGCTKYGRVDAILTPEGPVLLEINTIPGFTSESLFPRSAKVAGYEFPQLLALLMQD